MVTTLITIYIAALVGLGLFGFLGYITLFFYWKHRNEIPVRPDMPASIINWPKVTVQLPIFNEKYVVKRLINSVVRLDYPQDKLEIQVVDDSTDDTARIAADLVSDYRSVGYDIHHIHRTNREGYKAGALGHATTRASGEYVAIFDADFQPPPNFLTETVPFLASNTNLGMVQTRWGHLNDRLSPLTAAQAMAMDKHFVIEQTVRHRADFYPKFNGTAGIWRKQCIDEVGGWQAETVCEDLCLSTRAILKGWDFTFLPDVVTPGELPTSFSAYKNQQARWAKGSFQCLLKYGWDILSDSEHSLVGRLYALITMSAYLAHPFLLTIILLQIPLILLGYPLSPKLFAFSLLGLGQPILFVISQQLVYPDWRKRLLHFPTMMMVSFGLGPTITRSLLEILYKQSHQFIRTPKGESLKREKHSLSRAFTGYRLPFDLINLVDFGLCLYCISGLVLAVSNSISGPLFLLTFGAVGFGFATYLNLTD
ncbi:MAG: glycosyltransferase [Chloroflexota bacterium]